MDYLIFYSRFSPSCQKVLEEFPGAQHKFVMVDSKAMRDYTKKLKIVCVPTLIVLLGDRIVERVVGFEAIQNWLLIAIYRSNQLQLSAQARQDEIPPPMASNHQPSYQDSQPHQPSSVQYPTSHISPHTQYPQPQIQHYPQAPSPIASDVYETSAIATGSSAGTSSTVPVTAAGLTSLDDLVLDDVPEDDDPTAGMGISPKVTSPMNTIQLAEAMKKERDNSFEAKGKKSLNFERN